MGRPQSKKAAKAKVSVVERLSTKARAAKPQPKASARVSKTKPKPKPKTKTKTKEKGKPKPKAKGKVVKKAKAKPKPKPKPKGSGKKKAQKPKPRAKNPGAKPMRKAKKATGKRGKVIAEPGSEDGSGSGEEDEEEAYNAFLQDCEDGRLAQVRRFRGDVNRPDLDEEYNPVNLAAQNGHPKVVRALVEEMGVKLTPNCLCECDIEMVKLLGQLGACPEHEDSHGLTPLNDADDPEMVEALVVHCGADPNGQNTIPQPNPYGTWRFSDSDSDGDSDSDSDSDDSQEEGEPERVWDLERESEIYHSTREFLRPVGPELFEALSRAGWEAGWEADLFSPPWNPDEEGLEWAQARRPYDWRWDNGMGPTYMW